MNSQSFLRKLVAGCLAVMALALTSVHAQLDDNSLRAPVRFKALVKSPTDQPIGEMTWFEGYLGCASVYGETWTANTIYPTSEASVSLLIGQSYTISAYYDDAYADGPRWSYATFYLSVPAGFTMYINGIPRNSVKLFPYGNATVSIRRNDRPNFVANSILPSVGKVIWQVPVGQCSDGTGGGTLVIGQNDLTGVYSPAALRYVGEAWYDVELIYSGSDIRQVRLPSRLVDIVTVTNGYEIRFYPSGSYGTNLVGGVYPINQGAQPFTQFYVQNYEPATGKRLRIIQTTGTETDELEVYYDSPTKEWNRTLFHDGATMSVQVQKEIQASPRIVEITTTNSAGVLAQKTRATYQTISDGCASHELITEEVRDYGGKNYTNQNAYYTSGTSFGQKLWEKRSDGSWTKYDYFAGSTTEKLGLLWRTYEPFTNAPTRPEDASTTVGVLTTFDYVASSDPRLNRLVASREQRTNNKLMAKTTYGYALATLPDGKTNIVKTVRDFFGTGASDYVETVEKYFDPGLPSTFAFYRRKPHALTEPTGRRIAYLHQRGNWSGGVFTAGTGDYSRVLKLIGAKNSGTGTRLVQYFDSTANRLEDIYLYPNQSMLTVEIRSPAGNVIRAEERVLSNANVGTTATLSDFSIVGQTDGTYDNLDHVLTRTTLRGSEYTATYQNGRLASEIDLAGTKTEYLWQDHGRLRQTMKYGVTNSYSTQLSLVATFDYDAAGRLLTNTVGSGTEKLVSRNAYDLAGELVESVDANGVVRTRSLEKASGETHYSIKRLKVMDRTVTPEQTISEIEIRRYRDGRAIQSTGSGTVAVYLGYDVPSDGLFKLIEYTGSSGSPRFRQTFSDMLGRVTGVVVPKVGGGTVAVTNFYSSVTGLLDKRIEPGKGDTYFVYDPFGRLQREGLDVDTTAGLQDSSSDRILEHDSRFVKDASNQWWLQQQTFGFPELNQTTKILLARTRERLTSFPSSVVAESYSWGINPLPSPLEADLSGPAARSYSKVIATDKRLENYTDFPDATNDQVQVLVNGLPVASTNTAGLRTVTTYDALGRVQQTDAYTGNSDTTIGPSVISTQFEYVLGTPLLQKQKEKNASGSWITSLEQAFYADARVKWSKGADGRYTRLLYDARGMVTNRWGDGATPERYDYNSTYGDLDYLRTYRGGSGWDSATRPSAFDTAASDATQWVRDAATGLATSKITAANQTSSWGYDAYNRVQTNTSARALARIATYDPKTAEVTRLNYSDSTPGVTNSYNRLGLLTTVIDATGSRTFTYRTTSDYKLSDETLDGTFYAANWHLRGKFNPNHARVEGLTFGVATSPTANFTTTYLDLTNSFDSASARLTAIQSLTQNGTKSHTFTLSYLANSPLIAQISGPQSTLWKRLYEPYRSLLKSASVERGATTYARYQHTRDDLGRIDLEAQDGYLFQGYGTGNAITIDYDYDARGQLQRATSRVNNNTVSLPDRFYEVNYDNAANRSEDWRNVKDSAHRDAYTANNLNQYQSRGNHGYQNAIGFGGATWYYFQLTSPYSSTHNPTSPGSGSYFYSDIPRPGSSSVAEIVGAELKSVYGGSYGVQKLPYRRATETPQFDAAGNMTSEDLYTYLYDAEDRLIKITSAVGATASKEIRYDYQHRRVEEKDFAGTTLVKWRRFVWSGWMLLAEVNVDVGTQAKTVAQTFTWGPDVSGSVHGVAGIGGLLLVDKSSTQQYVAGDDGRGNVTVLLDALSTGTPSNNLKAGVEYGPYGEIVRGTGDLTLLPFRFQTKWALAQSWQGSLALEHLDFGRRVYVPTFGRFLNRDPIGEEGGANLYHYCGNDPINGMDPLGMEEQVNKPKKKPKDPRSPAGPQTGTRLPVTADEAGLTVHQVSLFGFGAGKYVQVPATAAPSAPSGASLTPLFPDGDQYVTLEKVIITGTRFSNYTWVWVRGDPSVTISSNRGDRSRSWLEDASDVVDRVIDDHADRFDSMMSQVSGAPGWMQPINEASALANLLAQDVFGFLGWAQQEVEHQLGIPQGALAMLPMIGLESQMTRLAAAESGLLAGSIRNVNPTGGTMNCVNCAIAGDATLAGYAASALPGVATPIGVLETTFGGKFQPVSGPMQIGSILSQTGNGSRGIVFGQSLIADRPGHVFNVINQGGTIRFLDAQSGSLGVNNFSKFQNLHFLPTHPRKP